MKTHSRHPRPLAILLTRLLLAAVFLLGTSSARAAEDAASRGPQPDMEPPQVVEAMMLALQKNTPEGIAELYRFSSPRNREQTGSLERFTRMIVEAFPDMLGHQAARMAPPLIDGDRAMIPVQLIATDNQVYEYVFLLSRQNGLAECEGCWMCDAVVPPEALTPDGAGPGGASDAPFESQDPAMQDTPA